MIKDIVLYELEEPPSDFVESETEEELQDNQICFYSFWASPLAIGFLYSSPMGRWKNFDGCYYFY